MNEQAILWFLGELIVIIGTGIWAYVNIIIKLNDHSGQAVDRHNKLDNRVTKIETLFALFGKKAADILHSPHTPELDALLEKYQRTHGQLTIDEWIKLKGLCQLVLEEKDTKGEKMIIAAFLSSVAETEIAELQKQL